MFIYYDKESLITELVQYNHQECSIDVFEAIHKARVNEIRKYIKQGGDINQMNAKGINLLMYACQYRQKEIAIILIKAGATIASAGKTAHGMESYYLEKVGLTSQMFDILSPDNNAIINASYDNSEDTHYSCFEWFSQLLGIGATEE